MKKLKMRYWAIGRKRVQMSSRRPYKLNLKTPVAECTVCAETLNGLIEVSPLSLRGGEQAVETENQKLEKTARALWVKYLKVRDKIRS